MGLDPETLMFADCAVQARLERLVVSAEGGQCAVRHRAFTLVELIVVIGVAAVLVGLILPAVGSTWDRAHQARDSAQLRQNVMMVQMYCRDTKDIYPLGRRSPFKASNLWFEPVVEHGLASSAADCDPHGVRKYGLVRFHLSVCMVYSPEHMRQGFTVPSSEAVSSPVGEHQIVYPSAKGLMLRHFDRSPLMEEGGLLFCCGPRWPTPVAMADGAVEVGDYFRYSGGEPVIQIDGIGIPVWTTWGGYKGRDK